MTLVEKIIRAVAWLGLPAFALAVTQYTYFAPGGALSCTGQCLQQSVNLAAGGSFITGTLPLSNLTTCATANVLFASSSTAAACDADFTWTASTNLLTLGSVATPSTLTTPAGSSSRGAALTLTTGNGNGSTNAAGDITIQPGKGAGIGLNQAANVNVLAGTTSIGTIGGIATVQGGTRVALKGGPSAQAELDIQGSGDFDLTSSVADPRISFQGTAAGAGQFVNIEVINDVGDGINFGTLTSATTCNSFFGVGPSSDSCAFFDTTTSVNAVNVLFATGTVPLYFYDRFLNYDVPAPASAFTTTDTDGFQYAQAVAGVPTGVPAHLTGAYANGVPLRFDSSHNRLYAYNAGWQNLTPSASANQFSLAAKPADTSRTSTTSVSDDPDLQFTSQAAGTYSVEWEITVTAGTSTTNLKFGINCTGTVTTAFWATTAIDQTGVRGGNAAQNACNASTTTQTVSLSIAAGNYEVIQGFGHVVTSTSGTISIQWAQATSNVTALVMKQGSWMRVSKIL